VTVSENNDQPERQIDQQGSAGQAQMVLPGFPAGFTPSMQGQFSSYQGPLPAPQKIADYEKAHPGAAAWILSEAGTSATHTRDMERLALRYQARDALLHRVLPFLLVALLLILSAALGIFANIYLGGAAFFGTLASVVTVYLKGSLGTKQ